MTENEAINRIQWRIDTISDIAGKGEDGKALEDLEMAIQVLEEIQQYREIGTVEGYERAIQISIENYNLYKEYKAKVQEFEDIGTIEEFKSLKAENMTIINDAEIYGLGYNQGSIDRAEELQKCREYGYNKAIDEFAEKLNTEVESFVAEVKGVRADLLTLDYFSEFVFEVAEKLKGGSNYREGAEENG